MRKNSKQLLRTTENSIKKSNQLALSALHVGLTLRQIQLLSFCILCTQQNGFSSFKKVDLERKFNLVKYNSKDTKEDAKAIFKLSIGLSSLDNEHFSMTNVFKDLNYEKGTFTFIWHERLVEHIIQLKDKYITTDLTIASKFNSSFTWILYDHLKAHYNYWYLSFSKKDLMDLFGVGDKQTYAANTSLFRKYVLDVAINEMKEHTEYDVWYVPKKNGRSIVGFDIHWSSGENIDKGTQKQADLLKNILDFINERTVDYINLDSKADRHRAIELIQKTEKMREFTIEPINITQNYADTLIKNSKFNLNELNRLLEKNNRPKVPFYNWLEEE